MASGTLHKAIDHRDQVRATSSSRRFSRSQAIRIVVADDHAIVRAGLRTLLEAEPDFLIVGEARTPAEIIATVADLKPDLLLLDAVVRGSSRFEVLERLRGFPASRIVLLTTSLDRADMLQVLRLGVRGVVLKDTATALLFKSIRAVMNGEYWIGRDVVADLVRLLVEAPSAPENRPAPLPVDLTRREREIVTLIVTGHTNREIAHKIAVTEDTVKHHLTHIFDTTGVSNRLELALFALHHHLVEQHASI